MSDPTISKKIVSKKNGSIDPLDIDVAFCEGFGARLDSTKRQYFVSVDYFKENSEERVTKVSVVFKRPEPTDSDFVLPAIIVSRDTWALAPSRLTSPAVQYRVPAPGARLITINGQQGYTHYETKPNEQPYDFSYTVECWGRYRSEAQMLIEMILVAYPQQTASVVVTDSENVKRRYAVFQQSGITDLTQISSMVDRIPGFAVTLKVEGELTLDRISVVLPSFTGAISEDGKTGTGLPIIRAGQI